MATFGERLKKLRTERGLTLDELKDILNTTKATLSRYENGLREPKIDFANKLASFFEVSLDYMLGISNEKDIKSSSINSHSNTELNKKLALQLIEELQKDGYEIKEEDMGNLILAAKIALNTNKNQD